jgi:C4-dicarboxylate-specific signal transduction histidine kinase
LSGSIAHELYQPLTAIVANVEAAEQMQPLMSEDLRGILLDVKNDVLRAGEVIARLRRMLANSPVETQELDLNEVVKETLKFLSAQASARGVTLRQGLTPQGPRVIGDRIQLQQVILNLVLNAMDAMANAGNGIILARTVVSDDTWVEVLVEDSGPGIPVDKLEQIFEPFFTTKEAGMGMGLSVARSIIVNLGGKIRAENLRGGGAVFRFSLPLARSKPAVAADEPAGR